MNAVEQLAPVLGVAPVCAALGVSRARYYRKQQFQRQPVPTLKPKPKSARALSSAERQQVLEVLRE